MKERHMEKYRIIFLIIVILLFLFLASKCVDATALKITQQYNITYANSSFFAWSNCSTIETTSPENSYHPAGDTPATSVGYNQLNKSDAQKYETQIACDTTSTGRVYQLFASNYTNVIKKSWITSANWSWEGTSDAAPTFDVSGLYLFNEQTSSWEKFYALYTGMGTDPLNITVTNISKYTNATNFTHMLAYYYSSTTGSNYLDTNQVKLDIYYTIPIDPPILNSTNNSNFSTHTPTLKWNNASYLGSSATSPIYHIQVDNNSDFSSPEYDNRTVAETATPTNATTSSLADGLYYWRVESNSSDGIVSGYNETFRFRVDTTGPLINIVYPSDYQSFSIKTGINVNYTIADAGVGIQSCWWTNSSGVANQTLTCGTNITVSETGDGNYEVTIYSNDTLGNIYNATIHYTITQTKPAVTLNYPTNNQYLSNGTNIPFNVTATDSDGIANCSLFGNWTGTWALNISNNSAITSGVMYSLKQNVTVDGSYKFNYLCYDQTGQLNYAAQNNTFTIDQTLPSVSIDSITTTVGSQTVYLNSSYTEANCNNTFYSVFRAGVIEGSLENISMTCTNMNTSFAVLAYTAYTIKVYVHDKAGNENYATSSFITTGLAGDSGGGGGGGALSISGTVPVIGLESGNGTDLLKEILYAKINSRCAVKLSKTDEFTDYSDQCSLSSADFSAIVNEIANYSMTVPMESMQGYYSAYKNSFLFQGYEEQDVVDMYGLFASRLGLTNALLLTPPSIDAPKIIISKNNNSFILTDRIQANKKLLSCEVITNTPALTCEVKNSTVLIHYNLGQTNFFSRIYNGAIVVTTDAEQDLTEVRRVSIVFRVYNFGYEVIPDIPTYIYAAIIVVAGTFAGFHFYSKRKKNLKARDLLNLGGIK